MNSRPGKRHWTLWATAHMFFSTNSSWFFTQAWTSESEMVLFLEITLEKAYHPAWITFLDHIIALSSLNFVRVVWQLITVSDTAEMNEKCCETYLSQNWLLLSNSIFSFSFFLNSKNRPIQNKSLIVNTLWNKHGPTSFNVVHSLITGWCFQDVLYSVMICWSVSMLWAITVM